MAEGTISSLPRRSLGSTGLAVTPLCIGCASLGSMPETFGYAVSEEQALGTLRAAFRSPINFLDTAASYGDGESERRLGLALRGLGGLPAGYVLSTKADRDLRTGDFSGDQIRRSVERSLRLLGLDRIQLLFLHDPEHTSFEQVTAPRGPLHALRQFRDEGVVQHVGVAGGPVDLMIRYVETGAFEVVITHNRYTLLNRSAEPLLAVAGGRGIPVLNAAPYGGGMLARGPEAFGRYAYRDAAPEVVERALGAAAVCRRYGVPLPAAALQFSLREARITSTIVGISSADRLAETLALAGLSLPEEMWSDLDRFASWTEDPERPTRPSS